METMDIYSKEGTKVVYQYPTNGYTYDQEMAAKYLELGQEYTVERTEVYQSSTDVFLKEFPGICFNSVMFK